MSANPQQAAPFSIQIPRKIGITAIVGFFIWAIGITGSFVWYASRLEARVSALEMVSTEQSHVLEDLREIKTDLKWLKQYVQVRGNHG